MKRLVSQFCTTFLCIYLLASCGPATMIMYFHLSLLFTLLNYSRLPFSIGWGGGGGGGGGGQAYKLEASFPLTTTKDRSLECSCSLLMNISLKLLEGMLYLFPIKGILGEARYLAGIDKH